MFILYFLALTFSILVVGQQFNVAPQEHFVHNVPGTYPRITRLSDNSILFGFTTFGPNGERILKISRSIDQGRTFAPHGEVARCPRADCDNIFLLEVPSPNGPVVLAAFRNHDWDNPQRQNYTWFRITICQSTDGGRSWTYLSQGFQKPAPFGAWEPFLRLNQDKTQIQLYFSKELSKTDQDTILVISHDRGRTWSAPATVTGGGERLRDGMVGVAKTRDTAIGRDVLVMVLETTRKGTFSVESVVSYDDGATWGFRRVVHEARDGRNVGAPQIASFGDGSVAVVFMTDEDTATSAWPNKASVKAVFSRAPTNGVFQWGGHQTVGTIASFWPGIMQLHDTALLSVYENEGRICGRLLNVV
ncbi:glycoside hydrolase [Cercophora samala]|uniref:Glycoside hydrolase n=1 Tax=Cercophora samala TaxID=330535 RepID=A0AA40D349_9PEZI|nr:glycoside hydrolase [Cercophora samala]